MHVHVPVPADSGPRLLLRTGDTMAASRRSSSGVLVVRLSNDRGWVDVTPFQGAMVWDAAFGGVRLGMGSRFAEPRPAAGILGTYGCLLYHAGVLRMGNPGPQDDHPLHGELPCAAYDFAELSVTGTGLSLTCVRDHDEGFGAHYTATASVTLRPGDTEFGVQMHVANRGARAMDLMYMAHANFDFVPGAEILQPAPWDAAHVRVRRAVPSHVPPDPAFLARLDALAADPGLLRTLDPALCDPEQVFYLHGLRTDPDGLAHLALRRPQGDGFALGYRPADFPHLVRWLMHSGDEQVAGFALPSTCEPEGYTAEKRKGHVQSLAPGQARSFAVRLGWLDAAGMAARAARIAGT